MSNQQHTHFFRRRLARNILVMLLPILLLSSITVFVVSSYMSDEAESNNRKILTQMSQTIELVFDELDVMVLAFDSESEMSKQLRDIVHTDQLTPNQVMVLRLMRGIVSSTANARMYLDSIYVYLSNENDWVLTSVGGLERVHGQLDTGWYDSFYTNREELDSWSEVRPLARYKFQLEDPSSVVTLYRTVRSGSGVVVMNILPRYIRDQLVPLRGYEGQQLLILNAENQILFSNEDGAYEALVASGLLDTGDSDFNFEDARVSIAYANRYGLKYVSITPLSSLYALPRQLQWISLLLCALTALLGVGLAYAQSRNTDRRLDKIYKTFDAAINNTPLPPLPEKVDNEYSYITQNLLNTFIRQNYLTMQLNENHYRLKSMELLARQAQINPHFMVNALRTIFWKSLALTDGEMNDVSEMIENLTLLLSLSLGKPNETLPLREELQVVCAYTSIQRIRYNQRFDVMLDVDKELLDCHVLKLLLQPLVENSVVHGFADGRTGIISINATRRGDMMHIVVADNGCGMPPEVLAELQEKLAAGYDDSPEHIGLYNTAKRIELYYSRPAPLCIESDVDLGTNICFDLPLEWQPPGPPGQEQEEETHEKIQ